MNKITYALESFKSIQDLIRFADQKAGAILLVVGLTFRPFVDNLGNISFMSPKTTVTRTLQIASSASAILSLIIVLYYCIFQILKPRFSKRDSALVEEVSIFNFSHLCRASVAIHKLYESADEQEMLKSLLEQQKTIAIILSKKNKFLSKSFVWLFIYLVAAITFILISDPGA